MSIGPRFAVAACLLAATFAHAQSGRPDPADPAASTPLLQHRSSFDGYRRDADPVVESWRATNDRVREAGGWRVLAREVDEGARGVAAPASGAAPAPGAVPASGHDGHHRTDGAHGRTR